MTARPIITMDETTEELWMVNPDQPAKPTLIGWIEGTWFRTTRDEFGFDEVRALADFLTQLEGANLLSSVGDEEDE